MLWEEYGCEGGVVSVIPLGETELFEPEQVVPLLKELCRTYITWEDATQLAIDILAPIVRQKPEQWLSAIESWWG
jgi:hypothetical protein